MSMSANSASAGIHRCSPVRPVRVGTRVRRLPWRTIDVHCHVFTPAVEALVRTASGYAAHMAEEAAAIGEVSRRVNAAQFDLLLPRLTSAEARLADMDAMGVDIQVLSPSPTQYHYWAEPDLAEEITELQNSTISTICASHPDRFLGLGTVTLQVPTRAAQQLQQLVLSRRFKGVQISTMVQGKDVADPFFRPFWEMAAKLGAIVFIHPWGTTLGTRLSQQYLMNTVGQPLETTICLSKLIFAGELARHSGTRIIAAHGGGYLPHYIGRSDHAHAVRPEAASSTSCPSEQLRQFWFDSVVHDPVELRHLIDRVGADRVVIGTDYPFDMGHYDPSGLVAGLPVEIQRQIMGGNATALLGLADDHRVLVD